jgi:hypothetical protein
MSVPASVDATRLAAGARGNLKSRFSHGTAASLDPPSALAALTSQLLKHVELGGPILATVEPIAAALRARYGEGQVALGALTPIARPGLRSIVARPAPTQAERLIRDALAATEPMRGAVAVLLPHDFDAAPHGGLFKHPSFHAKIVCAAEAGAGPVLAWYCWLHRLSLQGRKGGARVIYP